MSWILITTNIRAVLLSLLKKNYRAADYSYE